MKPEIIHLKCAIIKSGTSEPMSRSKAMPIQPFIAVFSSLPDNDSLDIETLRLKSITLLALCAMLRPSDIAPRSVQYVPGEDCAVNRQLLTSDICFHENFMKITFHGIKNDTQRRGFVVTIHCATDRKLCPVICLKHYINRTASQRESANGAVFLTLQRPYRGISAPTVSNILSKSIRMAGLKGYLPKDFRPTGATAAVDAGFGEQSIMKVGRWKDAAVFREHYVHSKIPDNFTDKILLTQ